MSLGNSDRQALLVIWPLGASLVIAIVSVFVDGTFDRAMQGSATVTKTAG